MKKLDRIEREWIESWTVEEAVAVYEFCTMMQDHLWQQHEIALNEHILEREGRHDPDYVLDQDRQQNLTLPFDDIPF